MSKPKYIKTKDGKFAGSIGVGKDSVPTIPDLPEVITQPTSSTPAPVGTKRSNDLHHFIEAHVRGWHWMAEGGARPSTVSRWDFIPRAVNATDLGTHPLVQQYPHLKPYLGSIRTPDQIGELVQELETSQPAQAELLNGLYNYADDLEELSQITRGACWECESLEGEGYCYLHADIGNMDIEDFLSDTLPDVDQAVMDDFLPLSGGDPEAAAAATGLVDNPFSPDER